MNDDRIFETQHINWRCKYCNLKAPLESKRVCRTCQRRLEFGEQLEKFKGYAYLQILGKANAAAAK